MKDIKKTTGTFASFDGTPIYYEVRGSGEPLVLAYGLVCSMNHWRHQSFYFANNYKVILFDYRGHHGTPAPKDHENLSIDALARDISGLMEHLELKKASFWGHSFGAQVLLRTYDLFPELFSNAVFINGYASNPIHGLLGIESMAAVLEIVKQTYQKYPTLLSAIWKGAVRSPLTVLLSSLTGGFNMSLISIKDVEVYVRGVASIDLEVFLTLFEQLHAYDATAVLSRVRVPTLIISGDKDGITKAKHQEQMHELIGGSELQKIPYGSHCTQLDLPDFVNLRIEKFLLEHNYGSDSGTNTFAKSGASSESMKARSRQRKPKMTPSNSDK